VSCAFLLAACGEGALLQDESGRFRVVARATTAAGLEAALASASSPHAIVAFEGVPPIPAMPPTGSGIPESLKPPLVLLAGAPVAAMPAGRALVVVETGAAVAVDCAVLAGRGIAIPPQIRLGTRVLTISDLAAGGKRRPAPGDLVAAMLRQQHGDVFAAAPADGARVPVGFVRVAGALHERVLAEVDLAAATIPGLRLDSRAVAVDAAAWPTLVAAAITNGARVVLVSADDWSALPAAMENARARQVAVIAIDATGAASGASCVVGPDHETIGIALGEELLAWSPLGASIVEFGEEAPPAAGVQRRAGFARALGLRAP